MGVAEIMREVRKLPNEQLLALAAQIDDEAARVVDQRFESLVREGHFADLAAEAQREDTLGTTIPLHQFLDERGIS